MNRLLTTVALCASLGAASALADPVDPHTDHQKAAAAANAAKPDAKPGDGMACPMMSGQAMAGHKDGKDVHHGKSAKGHAGMAGGKMMMDGKDMHCMSAPAAAETPGAPHDHGPAPK